jgi:hypothetical protein
MTLVFLDMAAPFARSGAVSGSTSTSQNWVAKPGATELGFTAAAATIGPPVCARLAAISILGTQRGRTLTERGPVEVAVA